MQEADYQKAGENMSRKCPECGYIGDSHTQYCPVCGERMAELRSGGNPSNDKKEGYLNTEAKENGNKDDRSEECVPQAKEESSGRNMLPVKNTSSIESNPPQKPDILEEGFSPTSADIRKQMPISSEPAEVHHIKQQDSALKRKKVIVFILIFILLTILIGLVIGFMVMYLQEKSKEELGRNKPQKWETELEEGNGEKTEESTIGEEGSDAYDKNLQPEKQHSRIFGFIDVLTDTEREELELEIADFEAETGWYFAAVMAEDLQGEAIEDYADEFWEKNALKQDGLAILVDMNEKVVCIAVYGNAIEILDDSSRNVVLDAAVDSFSNRGIKSGFETAMEYALLEAGYTEKAEEADYKEGTINRYALVVEDITWSDAYQKCIENGGHLVRIGSEEEYQAILRQIQDEGKEDIKFWISAARTGSENGEYHWIYEDGSQGNEVLNGSPEYGPYWMAGEPSFYDETTGAEENCVQMFYYKGEKRWVWNDVPNDILNIAKFYTGTIGYICEYEVK